MKIILKDYQQKEHDNVLNRGYSIMCWGTGVGKTYPVLKLMSEGHKVLVICPSHTISQWVEYCNNYNIPHTTYTSSKIKKGHKTLAEAEFPIEADVVICSAQTFGSRFKVLPVRDKGSYRRLKLINAIDSWLKDRVLVFDEFHRYFTAKTNMFNIFMKVEAKSYCLMSATPFERGAWELWYLFRIVKPIGFGAGNVKLRSQTAFKANYCVCDIYKTILSMNKILERKFQTFISYRTHEVDIPVVNKEIIVKLKDHEKFIVSRLKKDFMKRRQALNSFIYVDLSLDPLHTGELSKIVIQLDGNKKGVLDGLVHELRHSKSLLFFEFTEERTQLTAIKGMEIYNIKDGYQGFEDSKNSVMAVHYRSLGEGVRLPYIKNVIFYTLSMSNKMKRQSLGRGMFDGRTDPIRVFSFHAKSRAEKAMLDKQNAKDDVLQKFLGECSG